MRSRLVWQGLGIVAIFAFCVILLDLSAQQADEVSEIFKRIRDSKGKDFWVLTEDLKRLTRADIPRVREYLLSENPYVRIAASKFLYENGVREEAVETLSGATGVRDHRAQALAAELLGAFAKGDFEFPEDMRKGISRKVARNARATEDELTRLKLFSCLWNVGRDLTALRGARKLVRSDNPKVQEAAALVLAEMDEFTLARPILRRIALEPTDRGRLARLYLKPKAPPKYKYNFALLQEIIDLIYSQYYDISKVDIDALIEAAAKGLASSLDDYTYYMDEKAVKALQEDIHRRYGGIGARVSMRKDKTGRMWLTVEEPIFGGPAYRAGLRAFDRIVQIEGESTADKDLGELVRKLRGKPGTTVKFKVYRRGWKDPKPFEITREEIFLPTTLYTVLPGDIGYIRTTTFSEWTDERGDEHGNVVEVKRALEEFKRKGVKALIFDLRGNSGGLLSTCRRLTELFLEKGRLIYVSRRRGKAPQRGVSENEDPVKYPMVVLIDGGSASASEIMAGALRDHKRAILIGERTVGKGSVQTPIELSTTDGKTMLRLTTSKWFLPLGQSIESDDPKKGGIVPDIEVHFPEVDLWEARELERIRESGKLVDYLRDNFKKDKELFYQLARYDGFDTSRYPGFDRLYRSLDTRLEKEVVRKILREYCRRWVADDRGKAFIQDFQADVQLQRGIVEVCKLMGVNHKDIAEYKFIEVKENR